MKKIYIQDQLDKMKYAQLLASRKDIEKALCCSKRTAFRILDKYACAIVVDRIANRTYRAMTQWDLEKIRDWYHSERRGNPRFRDPGYQSELARRPRKRRLTP